MKIAFIGVKGMPYGGGIEKVTEEIGSRLVARGHEVTVYCDKAYDQNKTYYKGMNLKPLSSVNHPFCQKVSNSLLAIIHMLISHHVDVVHLHGVSSLFAPLTKLYSIRTVTHVHSFEWHKDKWNLFVRFFLRLSDYFAMWFADRIVVVSANLLGYFNKRNKGKVCLLRNGVSQSKYGAPDLIRQYGLSKNNYLLYIGRLSREKGVDYLIDAYNEIDTRKMLVLAGDFADDIEFHGLLSEAISRHNQILWLGYVDGQLKDELLSNAFCVVFPGRIEGSPVALLEAMGYGNCCVVSDIVEHLEILHGFGYTFRMGDRDNLRDLLLWLLSQKSNVGKFKNQARMYVRQNRDWENVVDSYENLCMSLVYKIRE